MLVSKYFATLYKIDETGTYFNSIFLNLSRDFFFFSKLIIVFILIWDGSLSLILHLASFTHSRECLCFSLHGLHLFDNSLEQGSTLIGAFKEVGSLLSFDKFITPRRDFVWHSRGRFSYGSPKGHLALPRRLVMAPRRDVWRSRGSL